MPTNTCNIREFSFHVTYNHYTLFIKLLPVGKECVHARWMWVQVRLFTDLGRTSTPLAKHQTVLILILYIARLVPILLVMF